MQVIQFILAFTSSHSTKQIILHWQVAELQKAEEDLKAKLKSLPPADPVTVPDAPLEIIPAVVTEEAKAKEELPAPALDETPKEKTDNAPAEGNK